MKYSIVINQLSLSKMGMKGKVKANHIAVLDVIQAMHSSKFQKKIVEGVTYVKTFYQVIADELSFFDLSQHRIKQLVVELEEVGFVKRGDDCSTERCLWVALTDLFYEYQSGSFDAEQPDKTLTGVGKEINGGVGKEIIGNHNTNSNHNTNPSNIVELTEIDKEYNSLVDYINEKTGRSFRKVDSIKKKFTARRKQGYEMQTFFNAVDVSTSKDYHQKNGFQYITPEFICREDKLELYGTQVTRAKVELKSPNAKDEYKRILAIGWDKCSEEELEWARAYQHADDARVYKTITTDERLPNKVGVRKTIAQLQYERDLG